MSIIGSALQIIAILSAGLLAYDMGGTSGAGLVGAVALLFCGVILEKGRM
jgi:hypothetical protein